MEVFWIVLGIIVFLILRFVIVRNNKLSKNVDGYGGMRQKYTALLDRPQVRIIEEKRDYIHFSNNRNGIFIIGQIAEGARVIMDVGIFQQPDGKQLAGQSFTVPSGSDPATLAQAFDEYVANFEIVHSLFN